jgi:uncharacterized membrane-anchored protein
MQQPAQHSEYEPESKLRGMANKIPEVTLAFWIIKICATTVGETGGDTLSMQFDWGYQKSTFAFAGVFLVALAAQVAATRYVPALYWAVIVATTTLGTTLSDDLTRTVGLGYLKTSILLFACVLMVLAIWRATTGTVSVSRINTRKAEIFYWMTILFSNTLGTALGDATADSGLGFEKSALIFAAMLALLAALYYLTKLSPTLLFWAAFILTRPLGATLGDILTKPVANGGLNLSRLASTAVIAGAIVVLIFLFSRRSERPGALEAHERGQFLP